MASTCLSIEFSTAIHLLSHPPDSLLPLFLFLPSCTLRMGVAVLNPHDCLRNTQNSPPPNMTLELTLKPARTTTHHNRPKRSQKARPASSPQPTDLFVGKFKILKRGEQHPQTDTVEEEGGDLYAGSSMFVASPPPSSVPLPGFVTKN